MNHPHALARRPLLFAIAAAFVFAWLVPAPAGANGKGDDHGRGKAVDTMTRNLYLGADLTPAIVAPSLEAFVAANGQILREVTQNDFPTRAEGLAREILQEKPDLVGLQEVALWRTAPVNFEVLSKGPSATTVRYDYLRELLDQLNHGKGKGGEGKGGEGKPQYEVVVSQNEFDFEAPSDEDGNPRHRPLRRRRKRSADDARRDPRPPWRRRADRARHRGALRQPAAGAHSGRRSAGDAWLGQHRREGARQPLVPLRQHPPGGLRPGVPGAELPRQTGG